MKNRNHLVENSQLLLNSQGLIAEEGWSPFPVWKYNRDSIKANVFQIKEWDYYAVTSMSKGYTVCGTISDLGYAGLFSVAFIDYNNHGFSQKDAIKFFTLGKTPLAATSKEDNIVSFKNKDIELYFEKNGEKRILRIYAPEMVLPDKSKGLYADLILSQPNEMQSMNIATSWAENRKAFYLNEKVNCMPVSGTIKTGNNINEIEENDVWGVLDWGRGRWTRTNTWYWGSGSGFVDGHSFGFNIGYGFSDRTPASENVIFYDNKAHKFEDVTFVIPQDSFEKPWKFTSSDGRFEMDFVPAVDRHTCTDFKLIKSDQHQVFGYFTGTAILDDGRTIKIKNFPAFAEKVFNHW